MKHPAFGVSARDGVSARRGSPARGSGRLASGGSGGPRPASADSAAAASRRPGGRAAHDPARRGPARAARLRPVGLLRHRARALRRRGDRHHAQRQPGRQLHPRPPDRQGAGEERRGGGHERQPGVPRRPARRRGGVQLAVHQRGDRGDHADRLDAAALGPEADPGLAAAPLDQSLGHPHRPSPQGSDRDAVLAAPPPVRRRRRAGRPVDGRRLRRAVPGDAAAGAGERLLGGQGRPRHGVRRPHPRQGGGRGRSWTAIFSSPPTAR